MCIASVLGNTVCPPEFGGFIWTKLYKDLVRITLIDFCQCNVIKGKTSLGAITNWENCTFVFNPDNPSCQRVRSLRRQQIDFLFILERHLCLKFYWKNHLVWFHRIFPIYKSGSKYMYVKTDWFRIYLTYYCIYRMRCKNWILCLTTWKTGNGSNLALVRVYSFSF